MALNLKNPETLHAIDENDAAQAAGGTPRDRLRALMADGATRFSLAGLGADSHEHYVDPTTDLYDAAGLPL